MILQWLSDLLQMFTDLVPRPLIVRADEELVSFVFGKYTRKLGPGWYISWPAFEELEVVQVKRDFVSRQQKFCKNGITYAYSWQVPYEITDALKMVVNTYDYQETIADFVEVSLAECWQNFGPAEICNLETQDKVFDKVRGILEEYGVEIKAFRITSHSEVIALSIWEK
ncbi:MAG: hypothetical protein CL489_06185 [Acidobacteria bacterium]|nr:hypothetical protein [Acidobacteriota bacterium]|tara:strand:+ start:29576 stop:30082 length:507 start_codon:yes stop_codon:yes gene_type:complete